MFPNLQHFLLENILDFIFSFYSILHNRWQYFYKSQVSRGFSPGASDQLPIDDAQPEHVEQLLAILTAYGRALDHIIDPHITQTVLKSLQSLHERWKLFDREFFKANLLELYLYTLFKVLLSHNGILYFDQLIAVLFNMGQSNVAVLHATFVSFGYSHDAKNVEEICLAKVIFQYLNMLIQFKNKIFFFTFF